MKSLLVLFAGWCLALAPLAQAQESGAEFAREMSVNADVQEKFYAKYPDLAEERDVVAGALRHLSPQETARMNADEAGAMLAERARTVLSLRSPQEWQRKAVSLYPELGVAGSEFNKLFLERYRELERTSPQFQQEPSWPVLLAKRCADELRARAQPKTAPGAVATTPQAPPPAGVADASKSPSRKGFWLSAFSVTLLAALLWLPAGWMFRISRAFGRNEETVTLWQRALRASAWGYLAVALLALVNTFRANADQSFFDRFGITLLVSVLAGLVAAIPVFVIAWGAAWWFRRAAHRAEAMGRLPASSPADRSAPVTK